MIEIRVTRPEMYEDGDFSKRQGHYFEAETFDIALDRALHSKVFNEGEVLDVQNKFTGAFIGAYRLVDGSPKKLPHTYA